MSLDQQAMVAPYKPGNGQREYNCHGAAVYWAARDNGLAQDRAYALYDRISEYYNGKLNSNNPTTSIMSGMYGPTFCSTGSRLTTPVLAAAQYTVGDLIFTEHPSHPMHSMIVVAVSLHTNTVEVRGYNNKGTFLEVHPPALRNEYDDNTRNLADRSYPTVPLYRVSGPAFCMKVRSVAMSLGFR